MEILTKTSVEEAHELLYGTIKNAIVKILKFEPSLNEVRVTLELLKPRIKEIVELKKKLDQNEGPTEIIVSLMVEGEKLVQECLKVHRLNPFKGRFTGKLGKFNNSLKDLLKFLELEQTSDVKENLLMAREQATLSEKTFEMLKQLALNVKEIEGWVKDNHTKMQLNGRVVIDSDKEFQGSCRVPEHKLPSFVVGLDAPLEVLKRNILLDGGPSVIVVTAIGGCGKTTLAVKFCLDNKEKFKKIFFVDVSKSPSLNDIVQLIAQHEGRKLSPSVEEQDAIDYLKELSYQRDQNPILLVLDDAKPGSEYLLNKLCQIPGYKILVTSRTTLPMFKKYLLERLNDEDAMSLFRHWASLENGNTNIPDDLVQKMVDRCKDIVLALEVVGISLSGKSAQTWLKKLNSILNSHSNLLDRLRSCLDDLETVISKDCFMDLGSFPGGQRIPAVSLIDIWSELYDIGEDYPAIAELLEFTYSGLANLVITRKDTEEMDGYCSEHFVTVHDLIRELAIHQSSQESIGERKRLILDFKGDNLPKWWKEQREQPINACLVSISTDDKFSSKWQDLKLPEAKVLVLNFRTKKYALPEFVKNMEKLKVLIVTNYSIFPGELSNSHLLGSLTNLERIRLEHVSIPSISKTRVQLKNLKKISLFMCNIGESFIDISTQISDVLPNLVEINIDFCNDLVDLPAGLCDLTHLKNLSITHCHKLLALPEEIAKLLNLEVLRLRSCINLVKLPDSISRLSELTFLDISNCFSIQSLPEQIGKLCNLRTLNMKDCKRLSGLPSSILDLEQLEDVICDEEVKELLEEFLLNATITVKNIRVPKEEDNLNWLYHLRS